MRDSSIRTALFLRGSASPCVPQKPGAKWNQQRLWRALLAAFRRMGTRFYFGVSSDDSGSDFDGNESSLPFPKPLSRSVFLEPDFDPTTFLASLSDRHQTLNDLRHELQELNQSLNKELLDLVNDNYQDFLSLGSTLRGGEEKVEEVRVSLLSFQRDLTSVRENVDRRREDVTAMVDEKRKLMKSIRAGRSLLDVGAQLEDLECNLLIAAPTDGNLEVSNGELHHMSDESDEDADHGGLSMRRLEGHVEQYLVLRRLLGQHPPRQPYILSQSERIARIKSTISLDLEGALKQHKLASKAQPDDTSTVDHVMELLHSINERD